ncbi:MAG TPA: cytochrome c [Steroidobacteraceae bacterium]|nr:cytochrome c [Steroidobacteraceae bacterium]
MPNPLDHPLARGLILTAALLAAPWRPAAAAAPDHSVVFNANCSMCHQLGAMGVTGQFPRLAGRAGRIAATAAGRHYLENVVLYGLMGTIEVDGTPIVGGVMPSFASLSNQDLAAALNYVISLDKSGKLSWKGAVIKPAQIARIRTGKPSSPMQVHRLRAALGKGAS